MTAEKAKGRRILVADDEESIRIILQETLEGAGHSVKTARDGQEALALIRRERFEIVMSDIRMPGMSGIALLAEIKAYDARIEVIIMTSHASLETSMEALRHGAYDYVLKPFQDLSTAAQMVARASERIRLVEENEELIRALKTTNAQLSESNELLAARATTISTLLDYSQAISALLAPDQFATETVSACAKLAGGRPAVLYRINRNPIELQPIACAGIERAALASIPAPAGTADGNIAIQAWLRDLESGGKLARGIAPPQASNYVSAITAGSSVTSAMVVFEQMGPFPPSVRAVLDKFMHQVRQSADNIALHESMRALAIRDGLTGLYNHRFFQDRMIEEFSRAKRHNHPLSLIFLDIDHFKKFNDTYGHPKGDALLRALARLIKGSGRLSDIPARGPVGPAGASVTPIHGRESDIAARYGGEEFVVILTETALDGAKIRAERLRKSVADSGFVFADSSESVKVTVSLGVATMSAAHKRPEDLVDEADRAVYAAKHAGRNRVVASDELPSDPAAKENG